VYSVRRGSHGATLHAIRQRVHSPASYWEVSVLATSVRGQLQCDGTRAETRFRLSAKRTSPFKSAARGRQFSRLLAAEVCASAVVMLDTPCSEVVWRVLATHSLRQFPHYFPSRASPCAIIFPLKSARGDENSGQSVASALDVCSTSQRRNNCFYHKPHTSGINCTERVYRRDSKLAKLWVNWTDLNFTR
jgi:hypothetical protein